MGLQNNGPIKVSDLRMAQRVEVRDVIRIRGSEFVVEEIERLGNNVVFRLRDSAGNTQKASYKGWQPISVITESKI